MNHFTWQLKQLSTASCKIMLLMLFAQPLTAQFTQQDSIFFDSTIVDYQNWLEITNLDEVLTYNTWIYDTERIDVYVTASTKEDWINLRNHYTDTYNQPIGNALLDKLIWQLAVQSNEIQLHITSANQDYSILIEYQDGEVVKTEPLSDQISLKGGFDLELNHIPAPAKAVSEMDIETAKGLIINYFKGHYESKKVWWKKANYDAIQYDNEISLEISNISKEILNDFLIGYYELILIDIFIEEKQGGIEINYTLKGKYGSGIFAAPRRSGYKDMEAKYPDYVERYNKKVRSMLKEILEAKIIKQ